MEPLSPVCAKCQGQLDGNAVFLKNGTHMCPACYQRAFPMKTASSKPKRFDISVEGITAIVAVIALFFIGYKVFQYVMEKQKEEAQMAREADEAAERRHQEDARAAEARRNAAALDKTTAEVARQSKIDAVKRAAEETAKAADLQKAEELRKRKEEELRVAMEAERQRLDEKAKASAAAQSRASELDSLANKLAEARKAIALAESDRAVVERKSTVYKNGLTLACNIKSALQGQYNAQFPSHGGDDISAWRNPQPTRGVMLGRVPIVIDHGDDYRKLAARFDSAVKDIQSNETFLATASQEIAKLNVTINAGKAKIEEVNRRMDELNATPEERTATNVAAAPKIATKTIVKRDGSLIKALSIIAAETEIRYTDEAGKWQFLDKADVKEIQ